MTPDSDVQAAIEQVYAAFARYERPAVMRASPARDPAALLRSFQKTPLRELSEEQIGPYSGWAMTTVGSAEDYKHFLPRILELAVNGLGFMGLDPVILVDKLRYGGFDAWPQEEQDAVRAYFAAVWRQVRNEHPNEHEASPWLRAGVIIGLKPVALLDGWTTSTSEGAMLQIASLAGDLRYLADDERGLWGEIEQGSFDVIVAWIAGEPVQTTLGHARLLVDEEDRWWFDRALGKG